MYSLSGREFILCWVHPLFQIEKDSTFALSKKQGLHLKTKKWKHIHKPSAKFLFSFLFMLKKKKMVSIQCCQNAKVKTWPTSIKQFSHVSLPTFNSVLEKDMHWLWEGPEHTTAKEQKHWWIAPSISDLISCFFNLTEHRCQFLRVRNWSGTRLLHQSWNKFDVKI